MNIINTTSSQEIGIANPLPPNILFGTSSWTYPGWQGQVYFENYKNDREFKNNCLKEYTKFPWFRTIGIDSSFYSPLTIETLQHQSQLVPNSFQWISKVWEEITVPAYAEHKRYGTKAGKENPNFLNSDLFQSQVLTPCYDPEVKPHVGPFVFEFQMLNKEQKQDPFWFYNKLSQFLKTLPTDFSYAVEVRNKELLTPEYFAILNNHNITHCFNHWSYMPALEEQMKRAASAGGLTAPFFVARILTPLGLSYARAVEKFKPYKHIQQELPQMRADVIKLAKRAIKRNVPAYIIVNNRSEGNAPETIKAISKLLLDEI